MRKNAETVKNAKVRKNAERAKNVKSAEQRRNGEKHQSSEKHRNGEKCQMSVTIRTVISIYRLETSQETVNICGKAIFCYNSIL